MWGRAKLVVLLRAEGFAVSERAVGRILRHLVSRGAVQSVPVLRRAKTTPARVRRRYARRLPKGQVADHPGGLVQIDTLTIALQPGTSIKQFTAYCPVGRWTVAKATTSATSTAAASFLEQSSRRTCRSRSPPLQVDGGSEFMADFETACHAKGLGLFVLPPKVPETHWRGRTRQRQLALRVLRGL